MPPRRLESMHGTCVRCQRRLAERRGHCKSCYATWMKQQKRSGQWVSVYVDAQPIRDHMAKLKAAGLSELQIWELTGVHRRILTWLRNKPAYRMHRRNADRILAVPVPTQPMHHVCRPHALVDSIGTQRRLQALVALGYTRRYLADQLGICYPNMSRLFRRPRVTAQTALMVEQLFQRLQMTPGPNARRRAEARRKGWCGPLGWDDDELDWWKPTMDEPSKPVEDPPLSRAEQVEELRYLGYTDSQIARKLGVEPKSLRRWMNRNHAA